MDKLQRCKIFAALSLYIGSWALPSQSNSQTVDSYWQQYKTAEELTKQQKYQQALDILLQLNSEQQNINVYLLIASAYSALDKPQDALSYYKLAYQCYSAFSPESYKKLALFGMARMELALRNGRDALKYYTLLQTYNLAADERALVNRNIERSKDALKKQEIKEAIERARLFIDQGKGEEAYQLIKPLLGNHTATVYLLAGNSYALMEKQEDALQYLNQALQYAQIEKNPKLQQIILFAIARSQIASHKMVEAKATYQKLQAMTSNKKTASLAAQQMANLEIEMGLEHVRDLLNKGEKLKAKQEIQPYLKQPSATVNLLAGDILASLEKPKEALSYYSHMLECAKKDHNATYQKIALFRIARMELASGNENQAKVIYLQLLATNLVKEDQKNAIAGLIQAEKAIQEKHFIEKLDAIQTIIDKGEGKKALKLLTPLLATHKTSRVYLELGETKAILSESLSALNYYQLAYASAKKEGSEVIQHWALFGIARSQIAINQPAAAKWTYLRILQLKLTAKERQLAQDGIKKTNELIQLQVIYGYLDSGQGWKAYELIYSLIKQDNKPEYSILAAESMMTLNKPILALNFYKEAYQIALNDKNVEQQIVALARIGSAQLGLDYYVRATRTFRLLLTYPLSPRDYELAKAGLVKSLAYRGMSYAAFDEIPWNIEFTSPQMVIPAIQTALWLERGDIAKNLYSRYQPILNEIKPGSYLDEDLRNIQWLLPYETAPFQLKPDTYQFKDSEGFIVQRQKLNARRYWSQNWQSRVALTYLKYKQFGQNIDGQSVLFNQTWSPSRFLKIAGEAAPTHLEHWNPVLWNFSGLYSPNDYISVNASAAKELIDGFNAVTNHVSLNSYILGTTLQPFPYIRLIGALYQLNFSDNNTRRGYNLFGNVAIIPSMGIYTGARFRRYHSAFQSSYYFSPDIYQDSVFLLGISRRIAVTWRYFAEGGYGQQTIKLRPSLPAGSAPTWYYKLGLRGPITRTLFLDFQYGNYQQASAFTNNPNYRYQEILGSLTFSFDK